MEHFVWIDNKQYRKGYTTGSCATAAAKVAALMVLQQMFIPQVSITTPSGVVLDLDVLEPSIEGNTAIAAIQKDGGDDIDVTHGMLIFAQVTLNDSGKIIIDGGEGVGRVTRKGVRHEIGSAAINDTPRRTIEQAVREVIGAQKGAEVIIFAPEGAERAQQTFNPRLGIMDGISILGTTGIVTPMSDESWKKSITLEIEMKHAHGIQKIIFVPGNHGEKFAEEMGMNSNYVVVMSNFVRYVLKDAERLGFKRVLLLGHLGKLIKVAAGIFHTHNHVADGRIETLIAVLALMGVPQDFLLKIDDCKTTEAAMELIEQEGYQAVYQQIALRIKERVEQLSKFTKNPMQADAILCSMDGRILGSSAPLTELIEEFRT
ncbi:cobalt-precorrin-5B (C(1))-methyltransferase CbiD [Entomomonas asaccharolytica]|uniref:Cobalt-precorrin-5B C(1)-methyltransferase n=1 Tax=Entomomonas asaccharolytica TaxID=2785331 RepID=A0A974NHA2_9GAMM|nr:cobalt-precorrin-5B (C(1))-methyltransferase CbiD [Entomomonas asaccharolytica]QQP86454.1 cobalt-precorrin-5B (C(1))-methyltransferase [Entomomonas asaccharolytica]